jgi:hypothetical protein
MGVLTGFTERPVKIYDVERKLLIKECQSLKEAQEFTGVSHPYISVAIKKKWRSYKNKLGITICFR